MVHNPTNTSYENVFLEVRIPYQDTDAPGPPDRKNYYPAWIDPNSCGDSSYDLNPGKNIKEGVVALKYSGVLLALGGHMHDFAKRIVLEDVSRQETVAALVAKVDSQGQLLGMPTVTFFEKFTNSRSIWHQRDHRAPHVCAKRCQGTLPVVTPRNARMCL